MKYNNFFNNLCKNYFGMYYPISLKKIKFIYINFSTILDKLLH